MENKEIKFELAKVALEKCNFTTSEALTDSLKNLYEWIVEEILKRMPEKYRDHLVTLRHSNWVYYSYEPVFDTDTQAMWDKELDAFFKDKQAWCAKYGCE